MEFSVLAKLLSLKDYDNKQAKLVAVSVGWASSSVLTRIIDKVVKVAMDDQISYVLLFHGLASIINLAAATGLVFLINKRNTGRENNRVRQGLIYVSLLMVAALQEVTFQQESHEARVNEWN